MGKGKDLKQRVRSKVSETKKTAKKEKKRRGQIRQGEVAKAKFFNRQQDASAAGASTSAVAVTHS